MKHILYLILLLIGLPAAAQPGDATKVLERTEEAFRKAGGLRATFTVKADGALLSTGTICLKGEKFVLETEGSKTWFDGHTQWTYLSSADEVNVSEPTPEELQSINPYAWLTLYQRGYRPTLESNASDARYYIVLLTALKRQDPPSITLYISRQTLLPTRIYLKQQGGGILEISIDACQTGRSYADSFFTFDRSAYPTAEVIDLR